jgi:hypothetical protein
MQFLHPWLLWALLALALPIIIHLFHFRRFKKVYFTNVKFLKEIKEEKSTRNKVRNLLVLLSRLAAFAFLIFAFAQPFLNKDKAVKQGKNYVSIFIDNSNSMMASSEDVPLLDKAKKKAEEIVQAYDAADQFQIMSHELKGAQQRWVNKENSIEAIEEIEVSAEVNKLSNVFYKQKQTSPKEGNHIIYLLSDFQESITNMELAQDTTLEVNLLPFQAVKENNITIDSAWFESVIPSINQNNKLYVRLKNHSPEQKDDVRLSIEHNGQTRPEGTVDLPPNSSVVDTVNILVSEAGWQRMKIKIDDYPIQFDDDYYINFNVKEKLKVISVHEQNSNKYMTALFKGLPQFELTNVSSSSIKYDELKDTDLVILSDLRKISSGLAAELKTFSSNGGNVLVFPGADCDQTSYNNFLTRMNANNITGWNKEEMSVHKINTSEFIFSNVYQSNTRNVKLPVTKGNYTFSNYSNRGGEQLLEYRNGQNYITKYKQEKGNLYVSAAPIDKKYSDLTINAEVFVPLLYKVAFSATQDDKIAYTIGQDNFTETKTAATSNELIFKIKGEEEFIPGQNNKGSTAVLTFNNMIRKAGFYDVTLKDEVVKGLAFNYDRIESNLANLSKSDLESRYGAAANILSNSMEADLSTIIKEKDQGITFWRWCLILALIFLAIETLLLRFWKV